MEIQNEEIDRENGLDVLRVEGWKRYEWLLHGFSTRDGGISQVYGGATLNLGWTKEDDPASVAENRTRFLAAVCGERAGSVLVGVRQIHSGIVRVVRKADGALEGTLQTKEGKAVLEGDGLITDVPGVLLGVGTADCVPVLVVDVTRRVVAAFHAGWRGTVARIVEQGHRDDEGGVWFPGNRFSSRSWAKYRTVLLYGRGGGVVGVRTAI